MDDVIKCLSKYVELTRTEERAILECIPIGRFCKGEILLEEGAVSHRCYFILQGCIRSHVVKNGKEITLEIYTEEDVVSPPGYGKRTPSEICFVCEEDTIACIGTPELELDFTRRYPELRRLGIAMAEVAVAKSRARFEDFKSMSAEERYLSLANKRPDILHRINQYQIASYLGIQPESLSRIRKRLSARASKTR